MTGAIAEYRPGGGEGNRVIIRAEPPLGPLSPAGEAAVLWLAGCNSLNTRRSYSGVLSQFARGIPETIPAITEREVLAYKAYLVNRGLSARTVRHHMCVLRSFFDFAIERGYHPGPNPAGKVPMPPPQWNIAGVALDANEVSALLGAARNARDRALLHLLVGSGLRAAEAVALRGRDVHFHGSSGPGDTGRRAATITVCLAKGGLLRQVDLPRPAAEDLLAYLAAGRRHDCQRQSDSALPLFQHLDGSGRGLGYWSVRIIVLDCAERAGLGHVTPHDLRRTYATQQLDSGTPLPYVQRQMGHWAMIQTVRYYHDSR